MADQLLNLGIIGGGVGGLALSVLLRTNGHHVTVFEQSKHMSVAGAGVQLSPNGVKVLRNLGVESDILQVASRPERIVIRHAETNKLISQIPLGNIASDRYSASFLQIHRSDLIEILKEKASDSGVKFKFGQKASLKSTNKDLSVISFNNCDFTFDAVIAADGVHSTTSKKFFRTTGPKFLKQVAYRATVPLSMVEESWQEPEVKILVGAGNHIVLYPILSKALLNIVLCTDEDVWNSDGWSNVADIFELSCRFKNFKIVQEILAQITLVHKWGLLGYENRGDWHLGSLALVGDACHPMLPYLAQGANQALEDVASLAYFLSRGTGFSVSNSLKSYSNQRRDRVLRVQKAAERNAKFYHLPAGPTRLLAHTALSVASRTMPNVLLTQFDWLYNYDFPSGSEDASSIQIGT